MAGDPRAEVSARRFEQCSDFTLGQLRKVVDVLLAFGAIAFPRVAGHRLPTGRTREGILQTVNSVVRFGHTYRPHFLLSILAFVNGMIDTCRAKKFQPPENIYLADNEISRCIS